MSANLSELFDQFSLRFLSKGRAVDGLWIGSYNNDDPKGARERAEAAFAFIKQYDPIQYKRILGHLKRIWVDIIPGSLACYKSQLDACVLDQRHVLSEDTSLESLASNIVHEATHARLQHWGIAYDEQRRSRIERICIGREVAFLKRLPNSEKLVKRAEYERDYCANTPEYFSNEKFHERHVEGSLQALRDLRAPNWFIALTTRLMRLRDATPPNYRTK
jgi:hypothetical protein